MKPARAPQYPPTDPRSPPKPGERRCTDCLCHGIVAAPVVGHRCRTADDCACGAPRFSTIVSLSGCITAIVEPCARCAPPKMPTWLDALE